MKYKKKKLHFAEMFISWGENMTGKYYPKEEAKNPEYIECI